MLMRPAKPFPDSRQRGIALLLTIVLLVFLVLVMVAMSSLVRVETQISVNTLSLAQAKQNALFGLNTAIGKLQETAGPDQRVTARADLVVAPGKPQVNLTGVWDTTGAAPTLITWLVNGNEDHAAGSPKVTPDAGVTSETLSNSIIMDADSTADHPLQDSLYDDVSPAARNFGGGFRFGDGHVYLVGNGSVDLETTTGYKAAKEERVILRKSPIIVDGSKVAGRAPGEVTIGNYAFWVADDGIKASLGTGNRGPLVRYDDTAPAANGLNYIPAGNTTDDRAYINRKMLNSLQLQGSRLDLALRDYSTNDILKGANRKDFYGVLAHPETENLRNNMLTVSQLEYSIFEAPFASPGLTITASNLFKNDIHDRLKQRFHDITPHSYSVLTNMITGGLRLDLSNKAEVAALVPADFQKAVTAFVDSWRPTGGFSKPLDATTKKGLLQQQVTITPPDALGFVAGAAAFPTVPVISEFEFFVDLSTDATTNAAVTPSIKLELWNPYNAILAMPTGQSLYVELPLIDSSGAEILSSPNIDDGVASPISLSMAYALGWDGITKPWSAKLALTPTTVGDWKPGEIKLWSVTSLTATSARDKLGNNITGFVSSKTDLNAATSVKSNFDINLLMGTAIATASKLYSITAVDSPILPKTLVEGLLYYCRLKDTDNGANSDWLNKIDPRGPQLTFNTTNFSPPANLNDAQSFDSDANYLLRNDQNAIPALVSIFDIPRQEVLGVGAFQHLVYSVDGGSYKVGSATAGAWNELFEKYFFSSVPRDSSTTWSPKAGDVLANTSMVVYDRSPTANTSNATLLTGLQSQRSAENLFLRDSFNINSTSRAAWRALLGGALPAFADPGLTVPSKDDYVWDGGADLQMKANWRYFDFVGNNTITQPVKNVFFRFPQTATNIGGNYTTLTDHLSGNKTLSDQRTAAYRLGLRELTKEQVKNMADNVVSQLTTLAKPFATVKEFVDAGILDKAILSDSTINIPTVGFPIPPHSPGYLTQADILQLIGHRLVARSDTFTIRAYGDVVNPVSGAVEARAWVEATVQRTPVKLDTTDNMTTTGSAAGNFGRQFKVISLRWLGSDEI